MDEAYIAEILDHVSKLRNPPADARAFEEFTMPDRRQGYAAEADEASRRYFQNVKKST